MALPTEATALLPGTLKRRGFFSPYRRVLLATFLLSTTFYFTSTSLIYAYRVFNCQEYYDDPKHPPYEGPGDACAITEVETTTTRDIRVMVILSTLSGTMNLLFTTWQIRHWGLRSAIVQQTFWPAIRNLTQIYATFVGGRLGITILQTTQLITILGGGMGYMLSANSYIAEVVASTERTAAFGVLAGMAMLGNAFGYVAGGLAGSLINLSAPFEITFCLLVSSTLYSAFLLPYVPPAASTQTKEGESIFSFLACLKVFLPSKYPGTRRRYWGVMLLGIGAFGGVLATAYVPMMLQLTATNQYGYEPADNGYMMSTNSLSRAVFLTFAFPRIIDAGRRWFASEGKGIEDSSKSAWWESGKSSASDAAALLPGDAENPERGVESPISAAVDKTHGSGFDLEFLRWSMVVDAALTSLVAFNSKSWHIMAAAAVLPLASGTAPAAKGVLLDIVPEARRADALAGISLLERRLRIPLTFRPWISTVSLFGALFAFLAEIGHPNLVFFCNAAVALGAAAVLFAVRFLRRDVLLL
ncbi:hypothetical protein FB45DRAFT_1116340 [Roridomyces roridus]|uniref:Uncharacterized protein n=1 Tax=Roridomyces roridus TaxID=1738132 RepID=A0AAD7FYX5_9AGAR|nr:hypothetical protein FB45DRAFT_1116340 [Roridomyces roridus]